MPMATFLEELRFLTSWLLYYPFYHFHNFENKVPQNRIKYLIITCPQSHLGKWLLPPTPSIAESNIHPSSHLS